MSTKKENLVALYVENASVNDKDLGKLTRGYNIVLEKDANAWMKKFPKLKIVSPEEVAEVFSSK